MTFVYEPKFKVIILASPRNYTITYFQYRALENIIPFAQLSYCKTDIGK